MARNAISGADDDGEPESCEEALICGEKIVYLAGSLWRSTAGGIGVVTDAARRLQENQPDQDIWGSTITSPRGTNGGGGYVAAFTAKGPA